MFRDLAEIVRISGLKGLRRLVRTSNHLKTYARAFAMMHALLALEKCGLNRLLLSDTGVDPASLPSLDARTLSAICEYLDEVGILTRCSSGAYKAKSNKRFEGLLDAMYACYAYHETAQEMHRLLTSEYEYGKQVVRDDKYDAIASATLTALFSYGLSNTVLRRAGAGNLLDLGCGTGEYLLFLANNGFAGELFGIDISEPAIAEGRARTAESAAVKLLVGDILDLPQIVRTLGDRPIDVVSFMFVLHEFDDEHVTCVLAAVRRAYPRARVLLTDLIGKSSEEVRRERGTPFPELKFVHQLSHQILRTPAEWKALFSAAGFRPWTEAINRLTNQACILFQPA
jgi:SAM-dependent methyltransferase